MISQLRKATRFGPVLMGMVVGTLFLMASDLVACSPRGELESINFGAIPSGSAVLVYIAQDQGFFQDEGLSVSVEDYPTGVATIDALLAEEVDIAWAAEFPMLTRVFAGEPISIFVVSSRFSDQYLIGLKDRGVNNVSDLRGKTIGLPLKTIAEFYLGRFLELNGMHIQDLSLVNVLPPQSIDAITYGSVDGVVTWEPYTNRIKEQMAGRIVDWSVQSSQLGFGVMIGRNDWLSERPQLVERFLMALVQAEDYLVRNPEAAKDILQTRVGYDDVFVEVFWSENQFELSLDQTLITAMEDEARWMINNDLTAETQVPNFLDYIYLDALQAVKPEAVNIIH
jgi:NitT/TauT family transport system substrate-binding protein